MNRSSNFDALRAAINAGCIKSLYEVFVYVTVRDLFKKAGQNPYGPALKRVANPRLLTLEESDQLAAAIGVSGRKFFQIIAGDQQA